VPADNYALKIQRSTKNLMMATITVKMSGASQSGIEVKPDLQCCPRPNLSIDFQTEPSQSSACKALDEGRGLLAF
jgi:hypothetical protein